MASVWENRFSTMMKRLLALRESTELTALQDIMPVIPVLDPDAPELYITRGEILFSATYDITAAAGQFATWWLENPANSNALVVVTDIFCRAQASQAVQWGQGQDAIPGAPVPVATDDERRPNTATRARRVTESAVAGISGRQFWFDVGVHHLHIPMQQVLPPGFTARLQATTAASRLLGIVRGYERAALPGELNSQ